MGREGKRCSSSLLPSPTSRPPGFIPHSSIPHQVSTESTERKITVILGGVGSKKGVTYKIPRTRERESWALAIFSTFPLPLTRFFYLFASPYHRMTVLPLGEMRNGGRGEEKGVETKKKERKGKTKLFLPILNSPCPSYSPPPRSVLFCVFKSHGLFGPTIAQRYTRLLTLSTQR